jgi:hypothetical protein
VAQALSASDGLTGVRELGGGRDTVSVGRQKAGYLARRALLTEWPLSADTVEEVGFEEAVGARVCDGGDAGKRGVGSCRCDRRRHPNEHRHLAEVLGGGSEVELVSGTAWTT